MRNKKAQVATATTWIVATLIIVVILTVFFYLANVLAKKSLLIEIKQEIISRGFSEEYNLFNVKTASAYLQTPENKKSVIDTWIKVQKIPLNKYIKS